MKSLILSAAVLAELGGSPALANTDIVPDNMGFAETVELFRTAAMHQPTFKTEHRCSPAHECATVEFAVRANEGGADFFIYPDKAPKEVIWCFVSTGHTDARLCQKAGSEPRTTVMWTEAYFPRAGEFREIDYGKVMDPDCKAFQHSQYDIDEDYVSCVVRKLDAAPPPPSNIMEVAIPALRVNYGAWTAPELLQRWMALNQDCRGGASDEPTTTRACEERNVVDTALFAHGYCYVGMGATSRWEKGPASRWTRRGEQAICHR